MHFVDSGVVLQMSIAKHGTIEAFNEEVFVAAVLICGVFAVVSMGKGNAVMWSDLSLTPLWLTGLVYGEKGRPFWEGLAGSDSFECG